MVRFKFEIFVSLALMCCGSYIGSNTVTAAGVVMTTVWIAADRVITELKGGRDV